MATDLGKAYVQIIPSAKGISGMIQKGIGPEASSAGSSAGRLLGSNLVSTTLKLLAVAGIGKVVKDVVASSIAEGAKLQQSFGGLDTLYDGAQESAKRFAKEAYKAGISANDYAEQVVSMGAALKAAVGGDSTKALEAANMAIMDMTDNAAKMGTPIESLQMAYQGFAKGQYNLLDNLKLGYGGTKSEMERLLADAEKLTGVKYDINNLSDVYSAIHAIQGNLKLTGVAAEEAKTTFSGSFAAMKASAKNVLAGLSLGQDIKPALQGLAETVATFLFGNLIPMVGNILSALPGAIVTFLQAALPLFALEGGKLIQSLIQGFKNGQEAFSQAVPELISQIKIWLTNEFPNIVQAGVDLLTELGNGFIQSIPTAISTFMQVLQGLLEGLCRFLPVVLEAGANLVLNLLDGIVQNLPNMVSAFTEGLTTLVNTIIEHGPTFAEKGIEIILNLVQGLIDSLPQIGEAAIQLVSTLIDTVTSKGPDIIKLGWEALQKLVGGLLEKLPDLVSAAVKLIFEFSKMILSKMPDIITAGGKILTSLVTGILNLIGKLIAAVGKIASTLLGGVGKINLWNAGKAIIDGFLNGLKAAWNAGKNFIGGIAGWIKKHKGPISYDKVLLKPAGQAIMGGFNLSLIEGFKQVQKNVGGMAGIIADTFDGMSLSPDFSTSSHLDITKSLNLSSQGLSHTEFSGQNKDSRLSRVEQLLEAILHKDNGVYLDGEPIAANTYKRLAHIMAKEGI